MSSNRGELFQPHTRRRNVLMPHEREPHPLCSVWPEEIILSPRPLCPQRIPGRKAGERYAFVMVKSGYEQEDLGNATQTVFESISCRDMALDIIGLSDGGVDEVTGLPKPVVKSSDRFEQGLFVPTGKTPTEDEIVAAENRMLRYMQRKLEDGDVAFAVAKNPREVPNEARIAARYLGVAREWSAPAKAAMKVVCPVCRQAEIVQGAQVCSIGAGGCGSKIMWDGQTPIWADAPAARTPPVVAAPIVEAQAEGPRKAPQETRR